DEHSEQQRVGIRPYLVAVFIGLIQLAGLGFLLEEDGPQELVKDGFLLLVDLLVFGGTLDAMVELGGNGLGQIGHSNRLFALDIANDPLVLEKGFKFDLLALEIERIEQLLPGNVFLYE